MAHPLITSWQYGWEAAGRSPRTMTEMRGFVERFEVVLGEQGKDLMTATRGDCEQFLASLPTPSRRNWAWRSLRSFYRLVSEDHERPSPMAKVKAPKVPLGEVTVATEDDLSRLLRATSPWRTFTNARDAAIISLLWASGMRRSELANLKLADVDLDTQTLVISKSKSGKSRRVPFDDRATQHLLRYLAKRPLFPVDGADWLWVGRKGPLGSDGVRQMLQRRRREAGVAISAHSFRRGLAARALRAGVSQVSVENICGWQPGSPMASRYVRMVASSVADAEYRAKLGN